LQAFFGRFELLKNVVHGGFVHGDGGTEGELVIVVEVQKWAKSTMVLKSWSFGPRKSWLVEVQKS
jgi:hypothetical protein